MSTYSQYKNLEKPLSNERYDVNVFNQNTDTIDLELHKLDLKNQSQDELLATKETLNFEIERAIEQESELTEKIDNEIVRAKTVEEELLDSITEEINRASSEENTINQTISELTEKIEELADRITSLEDNPGSEVDLEHTPTE